MRQANESGRPVLALPSKRRDRPAYEDQETDGAGLMYAGDTEILRFEAFLTPSECALLIKLASERLTSATVALPEGRRVDHPGRSGAIGFVMDQDGLENVSDRIAEAIGVPKERFEAFQVVKYGPGDQYEPHYDTFPDGSTWLKPGGQRVGSFLMYLQAPAAGGTTIFPLRSVEITTRAGDAIYFPSAWLHGSTPVVAGEKWSATK